MNTTIVIVSIIGFSGFLGLLLALLKINIDLYFLLFKLEKHPLLIQKIENVLNYLCTSENIGVFHKSFDELNANETDDHKKAVGRYICLLNGEYQREINEIVSWIKNIEDRYNKPYDKICEKFNLNPINKERLILPRIILCKDKLEQYGLNGYYCTFFHEIGHHFDFKENKTVFDDYDTAEKNANIYAVKLIKQYLPEYFLIIFKYRFDKIEISVKNEIIAYVKFLVYLIKKHIFEKYYKK